MSPPPTLIFGTANFGLDHTAPQDITTILTLLQEHGVSRLDTAGRYPPTNMGRSEELIGEAGALGNRFEVDTKILVEVGKTGHMKRAKVEQSLERSLERLGRERVGVLYIHAPDGETPLEEQGRALDGLHKAGKFEKLGVSNFSPELLEEFIAVCEREGFIKPTVYQGDYNAVTRGMEKKLLPTLRKHGIVFNAFRALAAGFLSGSLTNKETASTRFDGPFGSLMRGLYDHEELHAAVRSLQEVTTKYEISMVEASFRWVCYHSALGEGDGVLIGARTVGQLRQNLEAYEKGPLGKELVKAFEEVWQALEPSRGHVL